MKVYPIWSTATSNHRYGDGRLIDLYSLRCFDAVRIAQVDNRAIPHSEWGRGKTFWRLEGSDWHVLGEENGEVLVKQLEIRGRS